MSVTLARTYVRGRLGNFAELTAEQAAEKARLEKALNEYAAANWGEGFLAEMAGILSENLTYGFTTGANPFGNYVPTKTVGEFDQEKITERRGLKAYFTARGGHVDETKLRSEHWAIEKDTLGFHLVEFADNVRAGWAQVFGDINALGGQRLQTEQWRRFLQLMQEAVPSGSDYYSSGAGVDEATLKDALQRVQEEVRPDGVSPAAVTIIGRGPTVNQILDFPGFAPGVLEEIQRTGRLGVWRGANVVKLEHYVDEDEADFFPAGELWVLGGSAGRFVHFGGVRTRIWEGQELEYGHFVARTAIGAVLMHPNMVHRVIDSGL